MMPRFGIKLRLAVRIWRRRRGRRSIWVRSWSLRRPGPARWRRGRSRSIWGRRLLGFPAFTDVRQIRSHSHFPKQNRIIKNVIARCAATHPPFPIDVRACIIRTNLPGVAIDTSVRRINATALLHHSRLGHWINVIFVVRTNLRIEGADLQIWNHGQTNPRKHKGPEQSDKQRDQSFHRWTSDPSDSTGFKNVGTVEVRPRPNNIRPK